MRVRSKFGSFSPYTHNVYGLFILVRVGGVKMKICRKTAMRIWEEHYSDSTLATDFHGNIMAKEGFGNPKYICSLSGFKFYAGWNIHHILPVAHGGSNEKHNLICTSIATNDAAANKTTYTIDNVLYQVRRIPETNKHKIVKIK